MSAEDPVTSPLPPQPVDPAPATELHGLQPGELLARGLHAPTPTPGARGWEPPAPEKLSELIPQYHIEKLIGHGGMGAVYKGTQPDLERPVAIKILPAELSADEEFLARFQREARTLAKLQHPGIVAIYGFGQTSEGHLYIVMEFVDGTDLAQIIRSASLTSDQALELTMQICEALHYAHSRGVMHRDIKPANILVTKDGRAKLADFGLARPVIEDQGTLTVSGVVMGTPAYMAPEQRLGHADHRADIFALGVLIYEMLTGTRPRGVFDPPSVKAHVDVRLDDVVIKAMQRAPERRYQDVSELQKDVARIRETPLPKAVQPLVRPMIPPGPARQSGRPKKSSPMATAAWVIFPLLGLGIFFAWFKAHQRTTPGLAEASINTPVAPASSSGDKSVPGPKTSPAPADPLKPASNQGAITSPATPATAAKDRPFVNSLGMKFVPVPETRILMCIHETRKGDYAAYAAASSGVDTQWKNPVSHGLAVSDRDDHPVVNVSWDDARAFCAWLGRKEGRSYRLPTDREWSFAVGIGAAEPAEGTPAGKNRKITGTYPWGKTWPPPKGAGNFADSSTAEKIPDHGTISGYTDGYATTAPVMSFQPNPLGIYDLAGNAAEWCEDWFDATQKARVLRGGAWLGYGDTWLLSSRRYSQWGPATRHPEFGFRCVLDIAPSAPSNTAPASATGPKSADGPAPASIPSGKPVPGKAGFVFSPYDEKAGMIDVRGMPPGTKVRDPYTNKMFLAP